MLMKNNLVNKINNAIKTKRNNKINYMKIIYFYHNIFNKNMFRLRLNFISINYRM